MPNPDRAETWLDRERTRFPDPATAPSAFRPIALGGDLKPTTLLAAYSLGIFPWFNEGDPILWWSPDPRCVLYPSEFRLPRRSARFLRNSDYVLTLNRNFRAVIDGCAAPRSYSASTWITSQMRDAYVRLHEIGFAHSLEVWRDERLIGGVYGVAMGEAFFGESMFHIEKEASRAALLGLTTLLRLSDFKFIDCQESSALLNSLGAVDIARSRFLWELNRALSAGSAATGAMPLAPWKPCAWKMEARNLLS